MRPLVVIEIELEADPPSVSFFATNELDELRLHWLEQCQPDLLDRRMRKRRLLWRPDRRAARCASAVPSSADRVGGERHDATGADDDLLEPRDGL